MAADTAVFATAATPATHATEPGADSPADGCYDSDPRRHRQDRKRLFHNERERQRRSTIRTLFQTLRRLVPATEGLETPSDRQILLEAAAHLDALAAEQQRLQERVIRLRIENLQLRVASRASAESPESPESAQSAQADAGLAASLAAVMAAADALQALEADLDLADLEEGAESNSGSPAAAPLQLDRPRHDNSAPAFLCR